MTRFAWEGFSLYHPEDWAPVTITGDRREGYVRIASAGRLSCQVRWKEAKPGVDLDGRLDAYFDKLRKDARRAKQKIETERVAEDHGLLYNYSGYAYGRGNLRFDERTSRVFFIELTSTKADRLGSTFREIEQSFSSGEERWALLGLDVKLPGYAKIEKKAFLSGRTQLYFANRGVKIEAQRWGFGSELIAKHGFESWARSALELRLAEVAEDEHGLLFLHGHVLSPVYALVQYQEALNQIVTVKVNSRKKEWRPQWDWIE